MRQRTSLLAMLILIIALETSMGTTQWDKVSCILTAPGSTQEGLLDNPGICITELHPQVTRVCVECLDIGFEAVIWEGLPFPGDYIDTLGCNAIRVTAETKAPLGTERVTGCVGEYCVPEWPLDWPQDRIFRPGPVSEWQQWDRSLLGTWFVPDDCGCDWPADELGYVLDRPFEIVDVAYPAVVTSDGPRGTLTVTWSGRPIFPVTLELRVAERGCPPGVRCTEPLMSFTEEVNPLVFPDAIWCSGFSDTALFGYDVVLVDARGDESEPVPVPFQCLARGTGPNAEFRITYVEVPPVMISGASPLNLEVYWEGNPVFPVTLYYRPTAEGCPPGVRCSIPRMTFSTPQNPLTFAGAVWCRAISQATMFGYEVVMIDASGKESEPFPAAVECMPAG